MSHQTLISSSFLFSTISSSSSSSSPSSPSSLPLCLLQSSTTPYYQSSQLQGEKETRMEALKSSSLRHEACTQQQQQQQSLILAEEMSWAVERGNALGEVFSIDDLLDLGEFSEPEKEEGEEKHEQKQKEQVEGENSNPSSSSSSPELSSPHEIGLPVPDAAELEWVSLVMDDTLSEFPPLNLAYHPLPPPQPCHGRSQEAKSPTKATICALSTEALVPMKSKRSKRTRATSWSLSGYSSSSSSSSSNSTVTSSSSSSTSSILLPEPSLLFEDNPPLPKKHKPKKRGRKPKISPPNSATGAAGERRCSHCGVQKTPQWRAGPEGAKTLCNACGVRYKSGRLLPEYRPACSPTFVSDVHSNSHRKVLEMRRQKGSDVLASTAPPVASF